LVSLLFSNAFINWTESFQLKYASNLYE
jgi:hypothetical protein